MLDEVAQKRFGLGFVAVATDSDRRKAASRMRHAFGVLLKKDYSDELAVTDRGGRQTDYKWKINAARLAALPNDSWQFKVLSQAADKRPRESGKDVAARLKRETLLARAYLRVIHPYLCQDSATRTKIKALVAQVGLSEFVGLASPKGLAAAAAAKLYASLVVVLNPMGAAVAAMTFLALCAIGLDSICRAARTEKRKQAPIRRRLNGA